MPDHTLHAIDGTASNVLGGGSSWGNTGSFNYDEANTQIETLFFTDNDAHLTITDTSLELLKSKNGILQNSNAWVGGSWMVTGSDGSSFTVPRMLEPSHLVEGYLLFSQELADGVTYSRSNFFWRSNALCRHIPVNYALFCRGNLDSNPLRSEARGNAPYRRYSHYATPRSAEHPLDREKINKTRAQFSRK